MKADYRKMHGGILGKGGMSCRCCRPKSGKDRKIFNRVTRRKIASFINSQMWE